MRSPLLTTILLALAPGCAPYESASVCMQVPDDATTCPAASEVDPAAMFSFDWCDTKTKSVDGEGELGTNPFGDTAGPTPDLVCCYPATAKNADPGCAVGRPFREGDDLPLAAVREGVGWCGDPIGAGPVDAALAAAWLQNARMEHASVAAFARLTLDLMALGAPAGLLAKVQRAAADEVEHAGLCFAMASRFAGRALEAGAFPFARPVQVCADPVAVAVAAVREGCLGETLSAWVAEQSAARATDPAVADTLRRIAADEARHAALSWEIVAWLLRTGAPGVRDAVLAAFRQPIELPADTPHAGWPDLGILDGASQRELYRAAEHEVLRPALRALLAA